MISQSVKLRRLYLLLAIVVLLSSLIVIYYHVDPVDTQWVPKCFVKTLTGYDCPSCGVQRMLHSVLNGRFIEAFWLNPFMCVALPYLLLLFVVYLDKGKTIIKLRMICHHRIVVLGYVVLFFIWWFVRNTEWWLAISG